MEKESMEEEMREMCLCLCVCVCVCVCCEQLTTLSDIVLQSKL